MRRPAYIILLLPYLAFSLSLTRIYVEMISNQVKQNKNEQQYTVIILILRDNELTIPNEREKKISDVGEWIKMKGKLCCGFWTWDSREKKWKICFAWEIYDCYIMTRFSSSFHSLSLFTYNSMYWDGLEFFLCGFSVVELFPSFSLWTSRIQEKFLIISFFYYNCCCCCCSNSSYLFYHKKINNLINKFILKTI